MKLAKYSAFTVNDIASQRRKWNESYKRISISTAVFVARDAFVIKKAEARHARPCYFSVNESI